MGIPGDTLAVPLLEPSGILRRLGVPHIAVQKMISGGVVASVLAIPISVGFGMVLEPVRRNCKSLVWRYLYPGDAVDRFRLEGEVGQHLHDHSLRIRDSGSRQDGGGSDWQERGDLLFHGYCHWPDVRRPDHRPVARLALESGQGQADGVLAGAGSEELGRIFPTR